MQKPKGYDEVRIGGGFKALPADGYICKIIKAEETKSKDKGLPMLHIAFDICEGDYNSYFMNMFKDRKLSSDRPLDVKYPFEGQKWIMLYDYSDPTKTNRDFKSFCTALEDSGTRVWTGKNDDEFNFLEVANAYVGIIFQRVEHEHNGKTYWRTEPWGFRSVEAIKSGDFFKPNDKPLKKKVDDEGFGGGFDDGVDTFSAAEDDIPF